MGDRDRAAVFATFVTDTFPAATSIADVAGGHGDLSYWLALGGRDPTIIDPRAARLPKRMQRDLRKRQVRGERLNPIRRLVAKVEHVDLRQFDLVAALHPDQATEPTVLACVASGVDFAVVPCCVFPLGPTRYTQEGWINYLASLAPGSRRARLPISGANVVIYGTGRRHVRARRGNVSHPQRERTPMGRCSDADPSPRVTVRRRESAGW